MGDVEREEPDVLPEDTPVIMPELPLSLTVSTPQQMKALADPIRHRILGIIQNRPATAKQIADRLKMSPGTIGHHLQVLEAAGLAKVVARRLVRGIVARYYTRTARIFTYDFPPDVTGAVPTLVRFLSDARDELAEALVDGGQDLLVKTAFPHSRLTPERMQELSAAGKTVRLISRARRTSHGITMRVRAEVLEKSDVLACVQGTSNLLLLHTDLMGTIGTVSISPSVEQTAYGVFSDLVDIVRS